jgi:hypothetical protein
MIVSLKTSGDQRKTGMALAATLVIAVLVCAPASAAPVEVRFLEGVTHGYLLVRSVDGTVIGRGELTQRVQRGGLVTSRMIFRFKDGSVHDEEVTFSQQRVFMMLRYHLVQRGPSFPERINVWIDRGTAEYKDRSSTRKDGREEVLTGHFDLPSDVYNGMLVMVLKNIQKGANQTVSLLAFTPTPQVVTLQLLSMGEQTVLIADVPSKAMHYVFKPEIGVMRQFFGEASGRLPADFHYDCWILTDEVPSFVQFQGPLQLMGPILRIEPVSPQLLTTPKGEEVAAR